MVARARQPRTVHCAEYPQASNWISAATANLSVLFFLEARIVGRDVRRSLEARGISAQRARSEDSPYQSGRVPNPHLLKIGRQPIPSTIYEMLNPSGAFVSRQIPKGSVGIVVYYQPVRRVVCA
jgi:hypothetical protein